MLLDVSCYTHVGGHAPNCDRLACSCGGRPFRLENGYGETAPQGGEPFVAVLCDGLNGVPGGADAAAWCVDKALELLPSGTPMKDGLAALDEAYRTQQWSQSVLAGACTTVIACSVMEDVCYWGGVGDSRFYHFSEGKLEHVSVDDSVAFEAYKNGETSYADIRLHPHRSVLRACVGDERPPKPHGDGFLLRPGDALLLCSDGFWQHVFETEMELDLCKSENAKDWLERMLIRLTMRSMLDGDNLTALTCLCEKI